MEKKQQLQEIRRIYDDYLTETVRLEADRKTTDGLLGFGPGLGSNVCHDRFSERLEQVLEAIVSAAPSSQDAREVLEFMYNTPLRNKKNMLAYWMLLAVHALTEKLIGFLSPQDAADLVALYIKKLIQNQPGCRHRKKSCRACWVWRVTPHSGSGVSGIK